MNITAKLEISPKPVVMLSMDANGQTGTSAPPPQVHAGAPQGKPIGQLILLCRPKRQSDDSVAVVPKKHHHVALATDDPISYEDIPDEIWLKIFTAFAVQHSVKSVKLVNKRFFRVCRHIPLSVDANRLFGERSLNLYLRFKDIRSFRITVYDNSPSTYTSIASYLMRPTLESVYLHPNYIVKPVCLRCL